MATAEMVRVLGQRQLTGMDPAEIETMTGEGTGNEGDGPQDGTGNGPGTGDCIKV